MKQSRVISEYERLCEVRQGSANEKGNHQNVKQDNLTSQSDLAEELNIRWQMEIISIWQLKNT